MRSLFPTLTSLTLPSGAGSGTPRIVIGPNVPADLQAYYTGLGSPVVAAILHYTDATHYYYDADLNTVGTISAHAYGWSAAGVIYELEQNFFSDAAVQGVVELGNPKLTIFNIGNVSRAPSVNENWRFNPSMTLDVQGPFTVDLVSQGRGLVAHIDTNVNSAAVAVETIVLTTAAFTVKNGRAYQIRYTGQVLTSVASGVTVNVRTTNLAGFRASSTFENHAAGGQYQIRGQNYFRHSGASSSIVMVLTINASAGTVQLLANANELASLEVWDVADSSNYANYANV